MIDRLLATGLGTLGAFITVSKQGKRTNKSSKTDVMTLGRLVVMKWV